MAYKKIYYDEIWTVTSEASKLSKKWITKLGEIGDAQDLLIDNPYYKGAAADSTKKYFEEVHGVLLATLMTICQAYMAQAASYYNGYEHNVDSGDGSEFGMRYTTIVYNEVNKNGSVPKKIQNLKKQASEVSENALAVKRQIADLVSLSSPNLDNFIQKLTYAENIAVKVSNKAETYEAGRVNDFNSINSLIEHAKKIIEYQMGADRKSVKSYRSGSIGAATDFKSLSDDLNSCVKIIEDFQNSEHYEEAMTLAFNRDEMIAEEEKAGREWAKWIAVGVAVVGSVVVIVVTAGTATPLVCAAVGAGTGLVTAATNSFVDNYIENGSVTEGMDWSDFTKDCVIGTVTGAISAGMGSASSAGSVIKQPIEKAVTAAASSVVENAAEGLINVTWDVGEAVIAGKPGDEIISILEKDTAEMMKDMLVDGVADFAGGYVGGVFDVDSSEKGFLKKFGEDTLENASTAFAKNCTESAWDVGEAIVDPNSSETILDILKQEGKDFTKGFVEDFVSSEVKSLVGDAKDSLGKKSDGKTNAFDIIGNIVVDTAGSTAGEFAGGISGQSIDIAFGDRDSLDIKQVWEEKLDSGRKILEFAGNSAGEQIANEVHKEEAFYNAMKKKDYDGDGMVDVVAFDKYMVLKEDYDAAREVAGKGAYKDQTVQDILGLPKNTPVSEKYVKQESISIEQLTKSKYNARKTTNVTRLDYNVDYDEVKERLYDKDLFNNSKAGEYTYSESESGKTASGYLKLEEGTRDKVAQRTVGGDDRKSTDDGGHLIGTRFSGSGGEENLDAQNSNLNRSAYNKKEEEWEKAIRNGDKVYVHVETHKQNGSERPNEYMGYAIIEHKDGTRDLDPFVFKNKENETEREWIVIEK